ncbi:MAG: polynucleotide adenylyltransferase PcnB [Pseudohongiellaceae bacterium]
MPAPEALTGIEKATVIERDQHSISRKSIAPNALKVLYRLGDHGYAAFIVGGGVRDILLDGKPKDFDIATDATPEEVKEVFRNARIIGRRFKIVHIRFGREVIEVTTFRAHHDPSNEIDENATRRQIGGLDSAHSSSGMILRDNVYGNIDEDAMRRDFTVNALYYTTNRFRILDFCGGLDDLRERKLRMIGPAEERYREDPVRMLRAIRFAAKLGFTIEASTEEPINELAPMLASISPARLFDECMKLMTNGHSAASFALLRQYRLGEYLFGPTLEAMPQADPTAGKLVELALRNTDQRLAEDKSVTPAFLFAALLWPVLQLRLSQVEANTVPHFQDIANEVILEQLQFTAVPRRFTIGTKEIWSLQNRLERKNRRTVDSVFNHPRFRAAYDFLLLREEAGEDTGGLGDWWTAFQDGDTKQRGDMLATLQKTGKKPGKRRRRRRKSSENTP